MTPPPYPQLSTTLDQLARVVRTLRLDPNNLPLREHLTQNAARQINEIIERYGPIPLTVQRTHLTYKNETVYTDPDRSESLAWRLHQDGISSFEWIHPLHYDSARQLLKLLASPTHIAHDQDLVMALWSNPIPGVIVRADPLFTLRLIPQASTPTTPPSPVTYTLTTSTSTPSVDSIESLAVIHNHLTPSLPPVSYATPAPTTRDLGTRHRTVLREFSKYVQNLLNHNAHTTLRNFGGLYPILLQTLLISGDTNAINLLNNLQVFTKLQNSTLHNKLAQLASAENFGALLVHLQDPEALVSHHWLPDFFAERTNDPPSAFIPLYSEHQLSPSGTTLLTRLLWNLAGPNTSLWAPLLISLQPHPLIDIIDVLCDHASEDWLVEQLTPLCRHKHPRIRRIALRKLSSLASTKHTEAILLRTLDDPHELVRIESLAVLQRINNPASLILLVARIRGASFAQRSTDEQRALLKAFSSIGQIRTFPTFLDLLSKHTPNAQHEPDKTLVFTILEVLTASRWLTTDTQRRHTFIHHLTSLIQRPTFPKHLREPCERAMHSLTNNPPQDLRVLARTTLSRTISRLLATNSGQHKLPIFSPPSDGPYIDDLLEAYLTDFHASHQPIMSPDDPTIPKVNTTLSLTLKDVQNLLEATDPDSQDIDSDP